ncbi:hypothetical protein ABVK25_001032 [Lepraria finkii]|uniref:Uncharacterized protein n=1 Tax=Lepraria finkii TaxID=1340010 RepID=A0ABR4BN99_9LECA
MNTNINNLRTDITTLRTDVTTLTTDIYTLNTKFDGLELRMRAEPLNNTARVYNSYISSRDTPLRVLHDRRNVAVAGFPRDSASLMRLPGNTLTTLLNAFELPINGTVELKKARYREFIGVVIDV